MPKWSTILKLTLTESLFLQKCQHICNIHEMIV